MRYVYTFILLGCLFIGAAGPAIGGPPFIDTPPTAAISTHNSDTTSVHGISDTAELCQESDTLVFTCTTGNVVGTDCATTAKFGCGVIIEVATGTVTLPAVVAGYTLCVKATTAATVNVDINASDRFILDGVALDDGDQLTSSGAIDDTICVYADSAAGYTTISNPDSFTDGG